MSPLPCFLKHMNFVYLVFVFVSIGCEESIDPLRTANGFDTDTNTDTESESSTAGADTDTNEQPGSDDENGTTSGTDTDLGCDGIDLLFVIDSSGSMLDEQNSLVASIPKFIEAIEAYEPAPGEKLTYRIAVTDVSVNREFYESADDPFLSGVSGTDGVMVNWEKCGLSKPWIEGPSANAATDFACIADVGTFGSGIEMQMAAMEAALGKQSAAGGPNEGFYRRGTQTLLAVVIITDENDSSIQQEGLMYYDLDPVDSSFVLSEDKSEGLYTGESMKQFLDTLTGSSERYVVTVIAGPGPGECSSAFGTAEEATRLKSFTDACGERGVFGDICAGDIWQNIQQTLDVITSSCEAMPVIVE